MSWLTDLKCRHHLAVRHTRLEQLDSWYQTELEIGHRDGRFFKVIAVEVESDSREVVRWSQPLIAPTEEGLVGFLTTKIDDVLHVLVQARVEPGSADTLIVGPTVQCSMGFETRQSGGEAHEFFDLIEHAPANAIRYSAVQSEEGGRFYQVQNEYRIVELDDLGGQKLPENFAWVTLRQLQELLRHGLVSVEARTLLACLSFT
jgi:oxidase EvaA